MRAQWVDIDATTTYYTPGYGESEDDAEDDAEDDE